MVKSQDEELMRDPEFRRLAAVEVLTLEATELIAELLQHHHMNKSDLAKLLGKSRAYVTQMLSGSSNLTIKTLAEVAFALGAEVRLKPVPAAGSQLTWTPDPARPNPYRIVQPEPLPDPAPSDGPAQYAA